MTVSPGRWKFLTQPFGFLRNPSSASLIREINRRESTVVADSEGQLRQSAQSLRYRARSGESLDGLLSEAFALVREAARRTIGLRHFDVQLLGGLAMFRGGVAEMETGEGKTLAATLPLFLWGLCGAGAHLVTANDYLARRDAEWMRPVFELFGLSVGVLQHESSPPERRRAYRCDITYGTLREFGFDFLRDRLLQQQSAGVDRSENAPEHAVFSSRMNPSAPNPAELPLQRAPFFALVDEADNILIDEARTPLVIGVADVELQRRRAGLFHWAARVAPGFAEPADYAFMHETQSVELTPVGRGNVRRLPKPDVPQSERLLDLYEAVERAVTAMRNYHRDREYLIRDGAVVLIDASTGRPADGRKLRGGLHQAIEAAEKLPLTFETTAAAQVTVQTFFGRYPHLAGMTGTARSAARELRRSYGLRVHRIPTNRPSGRRRIGTRVLSTEIEKWQAVVQETAKRIRENRPVLIGTRSVEQSEKLSALLNEAAIEHHVLNARNLAAEAAIVARAGRAGCVTVATNMAGRGTDITLEETARAAGGLHIIATERHEAERIDRQLAGRCGRQGDPGTYEEILSLDDRILKDGLTDEERGQLRQMVLRISPPATDRWFRHAQRRLEQRAMQQRLQLSHIEQQRRQREEELGLDYFLEVSD